MTASLHPDLPPEVAHRIQERRAALAAQLTDLLAGRDRLTLEIGCGHGHYLAAYAQARPREFCLGIDIIADRIDRSNRKAERAGVDNLRFLLAEAAETLDALPPGVSLGAVLILFPDPWPKKRHHKNRIVRGEFLSSLAARSKPGAPLHFRTDHEPYYLDGCATLREHPDWDLLPEAEANARWPLELPTVFQQKAPAYRSAIALRR